MLSHSLALCVWMWSGCNEAGNLVHFVRCINSTCRSQKILLFLAFFFFRAIVHFPAWYSNVLCRWRSCSDSIYARFFLFFLLLVLCVCIFVNVLVWTKVFIITSLPSLYLLHFYLALGVCVVFVVDFFLWLPEKLNNGIHSTVF